MTRRLPVHLNRKPRWLRYPGSRLKILAAASATMAALASVTIVQAGPAAADPGSEFVLYDAVGSPVTQVVMDHFADDINGNVLGSYNATLGGVPIGGTITPKAGCTFLRPGNTDAGLDALHTTGCTDIARSESGPGTDQNNAGAWVYIPFAVDPDNHNAEVYNVVAYDRVVDTGDGQFDPQLAGLLAGVTSALCQDTFRITGDGFNVLGPGNDRCGATTASLRSNY